MLASLTTSVLHPVSYCSGAYVRWRGNTNKCFIFTAAPHPLQQCLYVASDEERRQALLEAFTLLKIETPFPDNVQRANVKKIVNSIVAQILTTLDPQTRNLVYEYVYHMALPTHPTPNWGEENAWHDLERLIAALNTVGQLGREPITCDVWMDWESNLSCKAHIWRMNRKPMNRFVAFVNGLGLSFDGARHDAYRLSDLLLDGGDVHLVYNASPHSFSAMAATPVLQDGLCFPACKRLLELLCHFFWTRRGGSETMLLACHSQGVAHARTALSYLPLEFRSRVRVLALAPAAIFIPADDGIQVVHVYKLEDPVLLAAHGFSMVPKTHRSMVQAVHHPSDGNPHNPHGHGYVSAARPYVDRWMRTGNLFDK